MCAAARELVRQHLVKNGREAAPSGSQVSGADAPFLDTKAARRSSRRSHGERVRLGRNAARPRGATGGRMRPQAGGFFRQVGRGAHPTAPEGGRAPRDLALTRGRERERSMVVSTVQAKGSFAHRQGYRASAFISRL